MKLLYLSAHPRPLKGANDGEQTSGPTAPPGPDEARASPDLIRPAAHAPTLFQSWSRMGRKPAGWTKMTEPKEPIICLAR
jgi:hypothetical protein